MLPKFCKFFLIIFCPWCLSAEQSQVSGSQKPSHSYAA